MPNVHEDPFDRMLIQQASAEGLAVWTVSGQAGLVNQPLRFLAVAVL